MQADASISTEVSFHHCIIKFKDHCTGLTMVRTSFFARVLFCFATSLERACDCICICVCSHKELVYIKLFYLWEAILIDFNTK